MHRPRLSFLAALILGGVAAWIVVWPQGIGIHRLPFIANVISLRGILALGFAVLALVAGAIAMRRRRWGVSAALAIALVTCSLGNGGVLLLRGWGGAMAADGDLTVVAWNAYGGGASPDSIARLVRETGADVVSLPETDSFAVAPGGETIPTSILISTALGPYARDASVRSTPGLPSGVWRSVDGTGPTLIAAHPMPPLPQVVDQWGEGLRWMAARCAEPNVLVAGDLNATVDHFAGLGTGGGVIGGCRDAAAEAGSAAAGTWPVRLPVGLAAPIDHVLVGNAWRVRSFTVLTGFDGAGSDHRPIVATLTRP
jgi:endonuclease/exonuclease/phosphatase (EEP) superfamily protein YafD